MAANTCNAINTYENSLKNDRLLMNKLRDSGLEYISTSGKVIPAKSQPGVFCHCPQKCKTKLSQTEWERLFKEFYGLADQTKQNALLQSHILIKAVHLHNWESESSSPANKRRVTCKYHIPDLTDGSTLADHVGNRAEDSIEVCQKAFMNCYGITEKRVRMQRERCISRMAPDHYKNSPFGKKKLKLHDWTDKAAELIEKSNSNLYTSPKDKSYSNGRKSELSRSDEPLDLRRKPNVIEMDQDKLYELAKKIGVSRERIQKEMTQKYEQMLKQNKKRQQQMELVKSMKRRSEDDEEEKKEVEIENQIPSLKAITDQVVGLNDDLTILPIQTLNNGDLTITPVLGNVSKPVENRDIMRVNYFFQNQLWKPEYLGLANWKKFKISSE